jgi:hypothetical protein
MDKVYGLRSSAAKGCPSGSGSHPLPLQILDAYGIYSERSAPFGISYADCCC